MAETDFISSSKLPVLNERAWLSFSPDEAGDLPRWLSQDSVMKTLAKEHKKIFIAAPDFLEDIDYELRQGSPDSQIAEDIKERAQSYKWYTERTENPAAPEDFIRLVKQAQKYGVTLEAIGSGPSLHVESEKSLRREQQFWRDDRKESFGPRTAASALFSPLGAVAGGTVRKIQVVDERQSYLSQKANFSLSHVVEHLAEEKGPFIVIFDAPKYGGTQALDVLYTKKTNLPLQTISLTPDEAGIDLSPLESGNEPRRPRLGRPAPSTNTPITPTNP